MGLVHQSVSVGTAVVTIVPAGGENYQFIAISNGGGNAAYLKMVPSDVALTTDNGIAIPAGATVLIDQDVTPILTSGISAVCGEGNSTTLAVQAY